MASVTNRKVYTLVKNDKDARLTEYNSSFIIYGKGEIQFKIYNDFVEFNIGHNFKSLDTGPIKDPIVFMGQANEKTKIAGY